MKKRTWLLLLALALLLMAGCSSEKTMDGTITEYLRGDTEVNAFLMEQDGKTIGVRLTGETGIYPALVDITNELTIDADGRSTLDITGNGVARTDDGLELAHVLCFFALVIQQVDLRKIIFAFAKKHHLSLPPLFVPCAGKTAQLL